MMKPLIDRVHSTPAKVGVALVGVLAVILWMMLLSTGPAEGTQVKAGGCDYNRASQYGPVSSSCDPSSPEIDRTVFGVKCAGAGGIGAAFGGPKGGVGAALSCAWFEMF